MAELTKNSFGTLISGEEVHLYTFRNGSGIEVAVTNFGGRVVTLKAPDRTGQFADVVLGLDDVSAYERKNPYLGAIVGRYANRIANAQFTLDGQTYKLPRNNGENSIHGGIKGFDKVVWSAREALAENGPTLELNYLSRDGEEGYPGNLSVQVTYELTESNELRIDCRATTDKKTVLNLTNHSYFDLSGSGNKNVLDHVVVINADRFTPVNEHSIPTGELRSVDGTPFDFRAPRRVGDRIGEKNEQLKLALGYDHNFVLNGEPGSLRNAARVVYPPSGRALEVFTTEPGIQFYTGNHLDGTVTGKGGAVYDFRSGFCLETQHFPDSPNQPEFPSTVLTPGQEYRSTTVFKFSIDTQT